MAAPNIPSQTAPSNIADLDAALAGEGDKLFLFRWEPTDIVAGSGTQTLYLSTKIYRGADAKPRLVMPSSLDISILSGTFGSKTARADGTVDLDFFRATELAIGGLSARNEDGELDSWIDSSLYGWGDADGTLLFGDVTDAVGSLVEILTVKAVQAPKAFFDERGRAFLQWQVKSPVLNPNGPIRPAVFAGTGGLEGGDDIEGDTKPLLVGKVDVLDPVFLKDGNLGHLIDGDKVDAIDDVHEGGNSVGSAYWTDNGSTDGTFDLDHQPQAIITADAKGWTGAGRVGTTGVYTLAANLKILAELGGVSTVSTAGLGEDGGLWVPSAANERFENVLDKVVRPLGIGPWPAQDGSGLVAGELGSPEDAVSTDRTFTGAHIAGIDIEPAGPPAWKVAVGWRPLGRPLEPSEAVGILTEADLAKFTNPIRWSAPAGAEDSTIKDDDPNALYLQAWSTLYDEADAATLAAELFDIYKVQRYVYRVRLVRHPLSVWIGQVVTLDLSGEAGKGKPTYGLDTPKQVMVTGWSVRFGAQDLHGGSFVMECWG